MKCLLTKLLVFTLCAVWFIKTIQYVASSVLYSGISKALVTINNYNFQDKVSLEKEQWVYLKKTTASVYSGIKSQAILDGVIFCLSLVLFLKLHKSEV
jgi:hypothetical protein